MFDIGWLELMVIGIVALIVVGPKDLPGMFRTVGQFMGKARGMAREFQRTMEAAADESGIKEAAKTMKGLDPLDQAKSAMKDYSKNYVTQKDRKEAEAAEETVGEALVKESKKIASPAAKATAPKTEDTAAPPGDKVPKTPKAPKKSSAPPKASPKATGKATSSAQAKKKSAAPKANSAKAKS